MYCLLSCLLFPKLGSKRGELEDRFSAYISSPLLASEFQTWTSNNLLGTSPSCPRGTSNSTHISNWTFLLLPLTFFFISSACKWYRHSSSHPSPKLQRHLRLLLLYQYPHQISFQLRSLTLAFTFVFSPSSCLHKLRVAASWTGSPFSHPLPCSI